MKIIPIEINDEYVRGALSVIGAACSHGDVSLRISFGGMWDGLTKRITWLDANGQNPTAVYITPNMAVSENVYDVPIPAEAKAYPGEATMSVRGVRLSGNTEEAATLSATARFIVLDSVYEPNASEGASVTPSVADQLQAQIDQISDGITYFNEHKTDAEAWAVGKRDGIDVAEDDATHNNNAEYFSEISRLSAAAAAESEAKTTAAVVHSPKIDEASLHWLVWDAETEAYVDTGKSAEGAKGDPFKYEDFTAEQLASLKGPKGDTGTKGDTGAQGIQGEKGDPFTYSDFTSAQLEALRGPQGIQGEKGDPGPQGDKGEKGDPGPQGAKGDTGAAFTYEDFTPEQLAALKGPKGDNGPKGEQGPQGVKGEKGEPGAQGEQGIQGPKGAKGDPFTYSDFTEAQLAALKGEKGDKGDTGTVQATPLFANSIDECTDTTKLYVLPDGYIYAYMTKSVTHTPTNQVPLSQAADGTPYNGGQGYKDNTRLSLSAGESSQNGYTVTGFIPVKVGDTIRFKNVNTSSSSSNVFIIFYDSSHNYVGYLRAAQATDVLSAGICVLDDTLALSSGTLDGTAFFRVSMVTNDQADYFFTINELTEPTIVTEEGWFSTDHAFVPADYEDRIIELEARVDDIANDTNNAPAYITNEAKRVSDVVKGKQTVGSLTFTAMSDMHVRQGNSYWADNVTSCRDAGLGFAELQKHLRLDFSALLGDYTVGGASDTVEKVKQDISIVKTFMSKGQKGIPNLWLTGNHDINYGASSDRRMTEDEMFAYITNNNNCTVQDFDNIGRNYGYIDFDNQKIRCIYLNTVDSLDYPDNVGSADDNSEVTAIQTQWLADVGLNLTAKSDAAEWGIVLFSHHCLSIFPHATTILTAYRNGASGSVDVTTNGVTTAVNYNFTSTNRGEIICAIHGHDHNFTARKISNERWDMITPANAWLWSICIPNIDTKRNNEKATSTDEAYKQAFGEFDSSGNPVYYPKTQGTATSTSFCVVTIDRKNRKIHAIAYGAGHDRELGY